MIDVPATDLQSVIHVIQTALTPIFLLTAIAGLPGVFTTRLSRISDQTGKSSSMAANAANDPVTSIRLRNLRQRFHALDAARTGPALFILFGSAILCTIGALGAFLAEMLIAGQGSRTEVSHHERRPAL